MQIPVSCITLGMNFQPGSVGVSQPEFLAQNARSDPPRRANFADILEIVGILAELVVDSSGSVSGRHPNRDPSAHHRGRNREVVADFLDDSAAISRVSRSLIRQVLNFGASVAPNAI